MTLITRVTHNVYIQAILQSTYAQMIFSVPGTHCMPPSVCEISHHYDNLIISCDGLSCYIVDTSTSEIDPTVLFLF